MAIGHFEKKTEFDHRIDLWVLPGETQFVELEYRYVIYDLDFRRQEIGKS